MMYLSNCFRLSLIVLAFTTVGCDRVSPSESRIIGTWEIGGMDFTARIVFRRDHVVVNLAPKNEEITATWEPFSAGRWRLEGNDILIDEKALPIAGYPSWKRITKIPVREFRADALIRGDGTPPLIRVSVRGERYAQLLALLAVSVSIVALATCVYLIRTHFFRKAAIFLTIAAALAFAWGLLLLMAELTQTGEVILSMTSLRFLQSAREVIGVASVVIFVIGCIRVALGRRREGVRAQS